MTMHKVLNPRVDRDIQYLSRFEEGRRLASVEDRFDTTIRCLEDYKKKRAKLTDNSYPKSNTQGPIERQQLENKSENKNNCMDISSDKEAKSFTKRIGHC